MSQHDFEIANQGFPSFRSDLNNGLQALASNSAGATAPSTTYAYQMWYDSTTNLLKMRNADDDAWITLAYFDQTNDEWEVRSAVIQAVDSAGVVIKTDDGTTRLTVADSGAVSINTSLDVDNIKIDGNTISSTDTNGNITLDPNGTGDINLSADVDVTGTITSDGADLDGAVVINESGADVDFRVESDTATNALFVEGSNGNVGIGTSSFFDGGRRLVVHRSDSGSCIVQITNSDTGESGENGTYLQVDTSSNFRISNQESADIIFYTNATEGMRLDNSGNLKFNSGYGSVATAYGCRAWVNFNGGASPITTRGSGNISSITDNGTGDYTINFSNAMPDANYSWSFGVSDGATTGNPRSMNPRDDLTKSTTAFRTQFMDQTNSLNDAQFGCLQFFR